MNTIDMVKYKLEIATFLGPTWRLHGDQNEEITNGNVRLWINLDSWKKKLNISARPHAETHEETHRYQTVLFDWIPRHMRDAWTLSIGCSLKSSEKVANDIRRRLLPDAETMVTEVKRCIEIDNDNTNRMAAMVATFKHNITDLPLRENRENNNSRWDAWMLNKNYNEIGRISIDRESGKCNVTINGLDLDTAAELFVKRAKGEDLIS